MSNYCAFGAKLLYTSYNDNDVSDTSVIIWPLQAMNFTPKPSFKPAVQVK